MANQPQPAGLDIDANEVIAAMANRLAQTQRDLAVNEAAVAQLQRQLAEARATIAQLQTSEED